MITGFKTALPGSITKFNLKPDMATWGKGIANGFSFCALTGTKEVMELGGIRNIGAEKVFLISTTHGGETHALAAGIASINEFKTKHVIEHNHHIGDYFLELCNEVIKSKRLNDYLELIDCNWMPVFIFKDKDKVASPGYRTLALQEMIKRGVLFQGAFIPCYSHTKEDIDYFAEALNESLKIYKDALDNGYEKYLVGIPTKPVFRKYL
jgi:spore coat polysaccharide biosynthesis protein SpsF